MFALRAMDSVAKMEHARPRLTRIAPVSVSLVVNLPAMIPVQRTAVTMEMNTPRERIQAIQLARNAELREKQSRAAEVQQLEIQVAVMSAQLAALHAARDEQVACAH